MIPSHLRETEGLGSRRKGPRRSCPSRERGFIQGKRIFSEKDSSPLVCRSVGTFDEDELQTQRRFGEYKRIHRDPDVVLHETVVTSTIDRRIHRYSGWFEIPL